MWAGKWVAPPSKAGACEGTFWKDARLPSEARRGGLAGGGRVLGASPACCPLVLGSLLPLTPAPPEPRPEPIRGRALAQHPPPLSPPPASSCPITKIPPGRHYQGPEPQGHVGRWLGPTSVQGTGRGARRGEIREARGALSVPSDAAEPLGPGAEEGTWHPWGLGHWNAGLTLSSGLQGLILGRPGPCPPLRPGAHPCPARRVSVPGLRPRGHSMAHPAGPAQRCPLVGSVSDLQGTQAIHTGWLRPGLEPASLRGHPRGASAPRLPRPRDRKGSCCLTFPQRAAQVVGVAGSAGPPGPPGTLLGPLAAQHVASAAPGEDRPSPRQRPRGQRGRM